MPLVPLVLFVIVILYNPMDWLTRKYYSHASRRHCHIAGRATRAVGMGTGVNHPSPSNRAAAMGCWTAYPPGLRYESVAAYIPAIGTEVSDFSEELDSW